MAGNETKGSGLPVPVDPARPRPSLARSASMAGFVSQLLAERGRRRGNPEGAVGAYAAGARIAVKRLPPGFRMRIEV